MGADRRRENGPRKPGQRFLSNTFNFGHLLSSVLNTSNNTTRAWSECELCAKPSILAFGVSSCIMGRLGGLGVLLGNESLLQSLTKCPIYASQSRLIKVQGLGHYPGKGRDVGFSASRGRRVLRQALSTQRTLAWEGCVDLWITMSS